VKAADNPGAKAEAFERISAMPFWHAAEAMVKSPRLTPVAGVLQTGDQSPRQQLTVALQ
jgi:hypothetical protein